MSAEIVKGLAAAAETHGRLSDFCDKVMREYKRISAELDDAIIDNAKERIVSLQEQLQEYDEQLENINAAFDAVDEYRNLLLNAKNIEDNLEVLVLKDKEAYIKEKRKLYSLYKQIRFAFKDVTAAENLAYNTIAIRHSIKRQLEEHKKKLLKLFGVKNSFVDISMRAMKKDLENSMASKYVIIDEIEKNAKLLADADFERVQNGEYLDTIDEMLLQLYKALNIDNPSQEIADLLLEAETNLAATTNLQLQLDKAKNRNEALDIRVEWKKKRRNWIDALTKLAEKRAYLPERVKQLLEKIRQLLENRTVYERQRESYVGKCISLKAILAKDLLRIVNSEDLDYDETPKRKKNQKKENYYDAIIFTKCFESAVRAYVDPEVKPDNVTGERMKLYKRFSIYYTRKLPDRIDGYVKENSFSDPKLLAEALRKAINFVLEENKLPKLESDFPVLSVERLKKYLAQFKADDELVEIIENLVKDVRIEQLQFADAENEEKVNDNANVVKQAAANYGEEIKQVEDSSALVNFIKYLVDEKIKEVNSKVARDIICWITQTYLDMLNRSNPVHIKTLELFKAYSDKAIISRYEELMQNAEFYGNVDLVIKAMAEVEGKKHDTMRKRMAQMKHSIIPGFAKEYQEKLKLKHGYYLY